MDWFGGRHFMRDNTADARSLSGDQCQGRSAFRWRPGQEASLMPPMVEPDVFQKQIRCIEGSTCDIVGSFRRPPQ